MRTPLIAPFTPGQQAVVRLIAHGLDLSACAERLGIGKAATWGRAAGAAKKIPSDLPVWVRIIVWSRGAPATVLGQEEQP